MIQFCIFVTQAFNVIYTGCAKIFSLVGVFPVCVHEVDRKDTEQTMQYVQSDQGLFLARENSVW